MTKNKSEIAELTNEITDFAVDAAKVAVMSMAATATIAEAVGIHGMKHEKAIVVKSESPSSVVSIIDEIKDSAQRREKEDHTTHNTSYSATQRSPGRTGKA